MPRSIRIPLFLALLAASLAVSGARRRPVTPTPPAVALDMHRSFTVTDAAILDGFSFERLMNALVDRSGTPTTALGLYQQWFDTQNPKPGLDPSAPHCDDELTAGRPSFNGFPRICPAHGGALARTNPFPATEYIPLALINRFDLAPPDGAHCGQYRMIYARIAGAENERLHLIFEAALPNPSPDQGIAGCRPIARFWADLSAIDSAAERRARLEQFFFTGIPGVAPVADPAHFSRASTGGIRSSQVSSGFGTIAEMFQFRLERRCDSAGACRLLMEPDGLEDNPPSHFFDARSNEPRAIRFREDFLRRVSSLAIRDVNEFHTAVPAEFLMVQADPAPDFGEPFAVPFERARSSAEGDGFARRIEEELRKAGSSLTAAQVVRRAELRTCFGCHFGTGSAGEGLTFPESHAGEHLSEDRSEPGEAGPRFEISPAMRDVFVPNRMRILREFLERGVPPSRSN